MPIIILCFICINILGCNIGNTYATDMLEMSDYLKYLSERDAVLSKNIANIDTPNYHPKDLENQKRSSYDNMDLNVTQQSHIQINSDTNFNLVKTEISELKPNNNGVTLEVELMKKSENALSLQETTNLYNKVKGMLKTSITGSPR